MSLAEAKNRDFLPPLSWRQIILTVHISSSPWWKVVSPLKCFLAYLLCDFYLRWMAKEVCSWFILYTSRPAFDSPDRWGVIQSVILKQKNVFKVTGAVLNIAFIMNSTYNGTYSRSLFLCWYRKAREGSLVVDVTGSILSLRWQAGKCRGIRWLASPDNFKNTSIFYYVVKPQLYQ